MQGLVNRLLTLFEITGKGWAADLATALSSLITPQRVEFLRAEVIFLAAP